MPCSEQALFLWSRRELGSKRPLACEPSTPAAQSIPGNRITAVAEGRDVRGGALGSTRTEGPAQAT